MGTRHHQTVIDKNGNMKLSQYGQWDGYPTGQGLDILKFLLLGNLDKYQENLSNVREMNKQDEKVLDKFYKSIGVGKDGWMTMEQSQKYQKEYFFLSRDCGSRIHKLIELGKVPFVGFIDSLEAKQHCEGFYTIDFQKRKFISEFHGIKRVFSLDNLPTIEQYLIKMRVKKEEIANVLIKEKEDAKIPTTTKALAKYILDKLKTKKGDKIKIISDVLHYSDDPTCEASFKVESENFSVYREFNTKTDKIAQEVINILKEAKVLA